MKERKVIGIVAVAIIMNTFAADPGGLPGLVKEKFIGSASGGAYELYAKSPKGSTCKIR